MTKNLEEFEPREKVPTSRIYDIVHDKLDGDAHALSHQVTAIAGTVFPPGRGCRESVRYRLHQAAEHVETHNHFHK